MRILILSGTGAIGKHLSQLLADEHNELVITSRQKREGSSRLQYIRGNAKELGFVRPLLEKKWDVIIDFLIYSTVQFVERIDAFLNATKQYVYLSSARVYAESRKNLVESSPRLLDTSQDDVYLATDEYALLKAREEDLLHASGSKNWTIIRPYITYSEDRMQLGVLEKEEWLYRALKGRTIVFSEDIASKTTTVTYGYDVARGIAAVVGHGNALGQTFHITGKKSVRWQVLADNYLNLLEKHLGFRPKVILADLDTFIQSRPNGYYQICYDRLFDRVFDNSAIAQYLDLEDFEEPVSGLTKCLQSFLQTIEFKPINWRSEALKDRICGERTPFIEINGFRNKLKYCFYRYFRN